MIATIRVVNIEEARTAIAMLEAYLAAHGEETVEKPAPKTVAKPKTAPKTEKVSKPVEEKKPVKKPVKKPEPKVEQEEDTVAKDITSALSLASITATAKAIRGKTSTAQVKEVIAKYTSGKLSTIKEDDYEAFVADLNELV